MSKHTPGPWRWQEDADALDDIDDLFETEYPDGLAKYMEIGLIGEKNKDIIPLRIDHYELEYDGSWINKADRDLIAAAPDMIEALKDVKSKLDAYFAGKINIRIDYLDLVNEAIAKAEGIKV